MKNKAIQDFLDSHPEWTVKQGKLQQRFVFSDFVAAFGFMTKVALLAERANHHPEWSNVYNKVDTSLITHEVNDITEKDLALASAISALVSATA